jgi:hypothetical protein
MRQERTKDNHLLLFSLKPRKNVFETAHAEKSTKAAETHVVSPAGKEVNKNRPFRLYHCVWYHTIPPYHTSTKRLAVTLECQTNMTTSGFSDILTRVNVSEDFFVYISRDIGVRTISDKCLRHHLEARLIIYM